MFEYVLVLIAMHLFLLFLRITPAMHVQQTNLAGSRAPRGFEFIFRADSKFPGTQEETRENFKCGRHSI
jgi:hypothetical protein